MDPVRSKDTPVADAPRINPIQGVNLFELHFVQWNIDIPTSFPGMLRATVEKGFTMKQGTLKASGVVLKVGSCLVEGGKFDAPRVEVYAACDLYLTKNSVVEGAATLHSEKGKVKILESCHSQEVEVVAALDFEMHKSRIKGMKESRFTSKEGRAKITESELLLPFVKVEGKRVKVERVKTTSGLFIFSKQDADIQKVWHKRDSTPLSFTVHAHFVTLLDCELRQALTLKGVSNITLQRCFIDALKKDIRLKTRGTLNIKDTAIEGSSIFNVDAKLMMVQRCLLEASRIGSFVVEQILGATAHFKLKEGAIAAEKEIVIPELTLEGEKVNLLSKTYYVHLPNSTFNVSVLQIAAQVQIEIFGSQFHGVAALLKSVKGWINAEKTNFLCRHYLSAPEGSIYLLHSTHKGEQIVVQGKYPSIEHASMTADESIKIAGDRILENRSSFEAKAIQTDALLTLIRHKMVEKADLIHTTAEALVDEEGCSRAKQLKMEADDLMLHGTELNGKTVLEGFSVSLVNGKVEGESFGARAEKGALLLTGSEIDVNKTYLTGEKVLARNATIEAAQAHLMGKSGVDLENADLSIGKGQIFSEENINLVGATLAVDKECLVAGKTIATTPDTTLEGKGLLAMKADVLPLLATSRVNKLALNGVKGNVYILGDVRAERVGIRQLRFIDPVKVQTKALEVFCQEAIHWTRPLPPALEELVLHSKKEVHTYVPINLPGRGALLSETDVVLHKPYKAGGGAAFQGQNMLVRHSASVEIIGDTSLNVGVLTNDATKFRVVGKVFHTGTTLLNLIHARVIEEQVQTGKVKKRCCGIKTGSTTLYATRRHIIIDAMATWEVTGGWHLNLKASLINEGLISAGYVQGFIGGNLENGLFRLEGRRNQPVGQFHVDKECQLEVGNKVRNSGFFVGGGLLTLRAKELENAPPVHAEREDVLSIRRFGRHRKGAEGTDVSSPGGQILFKEGDIKIGSGVNRGGYIGTIEGVKFVAENLTNEALFLRKIAHLKTGRVAPWKKLQGFSRQEEVKSALLAAGASMHLTVTERLKNYASHIMAGGDIDLKAGLFLQMTHFSDHLQDTHRGWWHERDLYTVVMTESSVRSLKGSTKINLRRGHIEGELAALGGDLKVEATEALHFVATERKVTNHVSGMKFTPTSVTYSKSHTEDGEVSRPTLIAAQKVAVGAPEVTMEAPIIQSGGDFDVVSDDFKMIDKPIVREQSQSGVSLGVTFFGSGLLEKQKVGRAIRQEDPCLQHTWALIKARDLADVTLNAPLAIAYGWNTFEKFRDAANLKGAIGKHLGITDEEGEFCPKITLRLGVFESSQITIMGLPPQLKVGGNMTVLARKQLYKGAKGSVAGNTRLVGEEIDFKAAEHAVYSSNSSAGISLTFAGKELVSGGIDFAESSAKDIHYQHTAFDRAEITASKRFTREEPADIHDAKGYSFSIKTTGEMHYNSYHKKDGYNRETSVFIAPQDAKYETIPVFGSIEHRKNDSHYGLGIVGYKPQQKTAPPAPPPPPPPEPKPVPAKAASKAMPSPEQVETVIECEKVSWSTPFNDKQVQTLRGLNEGLDQIWEIAFEVYESSHLMQKISRAAGQKWDEARDALPADFKKGVSQLVSVGKLMYQAQKEHHAQIHIQCHGMDPARARQAVQDMYRLGETAVRAKVVEKGVMALVKAPIKAASVTASGVKAVAKGVKKIGTITIPGPVKKALPKAVAPGKHGLAKYAMGATVAPFLPEPNVPHPQFTAEPPPFDFPESEIQSERQQRQIDYRDVLAVRMGAITVDLFNWAFMASTEAVVEGVCHSSDFAHSVCHKTKEEVKEGYQNLKERIPVNFKQGVKDWAMGAYVGYLESRERSIRSSGLDPQLARQLTYDTDKVIFFSLGMLASIPVAKAGVLVAKKTVVPVIKHTVRATIVTGKALKTGLSMIGPSGSGPKVSRMGGFIRFGDGEGIKAFAEKILGKKVEVVEHFFRGCKSVQEPGTSTPLMAILESVKYRADVKGLEQLASLGLKELEVPKLIKAQKGLIATTYPEGDTLATYFTLENLQRLGAALGELGSKMPGGAVSPQIGKTLLKNGKQVMQKKGFPFTYKELEQLVREFSGTPASYSLYDAELDHFIAQGQKLTFFKDFHLLEQHGSAALDYHGFLYKIERSAGPQELDAFRKGYQMAIPEEASRFARIYWLIHDLSLDETMPGTMKRLQAEFANWPSRPPLTLERIEVQEAKKFWGAESVVEIEVDGTVTRLPVKDFSRFLETEKPKSVRIEGYAKTDEFLKQIEALKKVSANSTIKEVAPGYPDKYFRMELVFARDLKSVPRVEASKQPLASRPSKEAPKTVKALAQKIAEKPVKIVPAEEMFPALNEGGFSVIVEEATNAPLLMVRELFESLIPHELKGIRFLSDLELKRFHVPKLIESSANLYAASFKEGTVIQSFFTRLAKAGEWKTGLLKSLTEALNLVGEAAGELGCRKPGHFVPANEIDRLGRGLVNLIEMNDLQAPFTVEDIGLLVKELKKHPIPASYTMGEDLGSILLHREGKISLMSYYDVAQSIGEVMEPTDMVAMKFYGFMYQIERNGFKSNLAAEEIIALKEAFSQGFKRTYPGDVPAAANRFAQVYWAFMDIMSGNKADGHYALHTLFREWPSKPPLTLDRIAKQSTNARAAEIARGLKGKEPVRNLLQFDAVVPPPHFIDISSHVNLTPETLGHAIAKLIAENNAGSVQIQAYFTEGKPFVDKIIEQLKLFDKKVKMDLKFELVCPGYPAHQATFRLELPKAIQTPEGLKPRLQLVPPLKAETPPLKIGASELKVPPPYRAKPLDAEYLYDSGVSWERMVLILAKNDKSSPVHSLTMCKYFTHLTEHNLGYVNLTAENIMPVLQELMQKSRIAGTKSSIIQHRSLNSYQELMQLIQAVRRYDTQVSIAVKPQFNMGVTKLRAYEVEFTIPLDRAPKPSLSFAPRETLPTRKEIISKIEGCPPDLKIHSLMEVSIVDPETKVEHWLSYGVNIDEASLQELLYEASLKCKTLQNVKITLSCQTARPAEMLSLFEYGLPFNEENKIIFGETVKWIDGVHAERMQITLNKLEVPPPPKKSVAITDSMRLPPEQQRRLDSIIEAVQTFTLEDPSLNVLKTPPFDMAAHFYGAFSRIHPIKKVSKGSVTLFKAGKNLGYAQKFDDTYEIMQELKGLHYFNKLKLQRAQVPEILGCDLEADGATLYTSFVPGEPIELLMEKLTLEGPGRDEVLQTLNTALQKLGEALGELHSKERRFPVEEKTIQWYIEELRGNHKNFEYFAKERNWELPHTRHELEQLIEAFQKEEHFSGFAVEDAHFGNFLFDAKSGQISFIDLVSHGTISPLGLPQESALKYFHWTLDILKSSYPQLKLPELRMLEKTLRDAYASTFEGGVPPASNRFFEAYTSYNRIEDFLFQLPHMDAVERAEAEIFLPRFFKPKRQQEFYLVPGETAEHFAKKVMGERNFALSHAHTVLTPSERGNNGTLHFIFEGDSKIPTALIKEVTNSFKEEVRMMQMIQRMDVSFDYPELLGYGQSIDGRKGYIAMSYLNGKGISYQLKKACSLPAGSSERQAAMQGVEGALERVGEALAEFHNCDRSVACPPSEDYLKQLWNAFEGMADHVNKQADKIGRPITLSEKLLRDIPGEFMDAPGPAGRVHGDAHVKNFLDDGQRTAMIDFGLTGRSVSKKGEPIGTPVMDVEQMTLSLELLAQHVVRGEEGLYLKKAFLRGYNSKFAGYHPEKARRFARLYALYRNADQTLDKPIEARYVIDTINREFGALTPVGKTLEDFAQRVTGAREVVLKPLEGNSFKIGDEPVIIKKLKVEEAMSEWQALELMGLHPFKHFTPPKLLAKEKCGDGFWYIAIHRIEGKSVPPVEKVSAAFEELIKFGRRPGKPPFDTSLDREAARLRKLFVEKKHPSVTQEEVERVIAGLYQNPGDACLVYGLSPSTLIWNGEKLSLRSLAEITGRISSKNFDGLLSTDFVNLVEQYPTLRPPAGMTAEARAFSELVHKLENHKMTLELVPQYEIPDLPLMIGPAEFKSIHQTPKPPLDLARLTELHPLLEGYPELLQMKPRTLTTLKHDIFTDFNFLEVLREAPKGRFVEIRHITTHPAHEWMEIVRTARSFDPQAAIRIELKPYGAEIDLFLNAEKPKLTLAPPQVAGRSYPSIVEIIEKGEVEDVVRIAKKFKGEMVVHNLAEVFLSDTGSTARISLSGALNIDEAIFRDIFKQASGLTGNLKKPTLTVYGYFAEPADILALFEKVVPACEWASIDIEEAVQLVQGVEAQRIMFSIRLSSPKEPKLSFVIGPDKVQKPLATLQEGPSKTFIGELEIDNITPDTFFQILQAESAESTAIIHFTERPFEEVVNLIDCALVFDKNAAITIRPQAVTEVTILLRRQMPQPALISAQAPAPTLTEILSSTGNKEVKELAQTLKAQLEDWKPPKEIHSLAEVSLNDRKTGAFNLDEKTFRALYEEVMALKAPVLNITGYFTQLADLLTIVQKVVSPTASAEVRVLGSAKLVKKGALTRHVSIEITMPVNVAEKKIAREFLKGYDPILTQLKGSVFRITHPHRSTSYIMKEFKAAEWHALNLFKDQKPTHFHVPKVVHVQDKALIMEEMPGRTLEDFFAALGKMRGLEREKALEELLPAFAQAGRMIAELGQFKVEKGAPSLEPTFAKLLEMAKQLKDLPGAPSEAEVAQAIKLLKQRMPKESCFVHRDLKPDNVMYDPETGQLSLIDFASSAAAGLEGEDLTTFLYNIGVWGMAHELEEAEVQKLTHVFLKGFASLAFAPPGEAAVEISRLKSLLNHLKQVAESPLFKLSVLTAGVLTLPENPVMAFFPAAEAKEVEKKDKVNFTELWKSYRYIDLMERPIWMDNTCAINVSKALMAVGAPPMTRKHGETAKVQGVSVLFRINDLDKYLRTEKIGKFRKVTRFEEILWSEGILIFKDVANFGATGHMTIWDGLETHPNDRYCSRVNCNKYLFQKAKAVHFYEFETINVYEYIRRHPNPTEKSEGDHHQGYTNYENLGESQ